MQVVEFGRLTDQARVDLEGDETDPFDAAGVPLSFRPKERHVALRADDGHLVASTGIVEVEVEVASERFEVVGIGGVIVNARHRGRGLARKVVESALERAASLGPTFALLFCHDDRAGLYERLGFSTVPPPVLVEQPEGEVEMPQRTMWRALRADASWPEGPLVVRSLPF